MKTAWTIIPAALIGLALISEPLMLIPGAYFTGVGESELRQLADATGETLPQVRDHVIRVRIGANIQIPATGEAEYLFKARRSGQFLVSASPASVQLDVSAIGPGSNAFSRQTSSSRSAGARLSLESGSLIYVRVDDSEMRGRARLSITEPLRNASIDSDVKRVIAAGWEEWNFDPTALATITPGDPANGRISAGEEDFYLVPARSDLPFRVSLDSDEFDPYLEAWEVNEGGIVEEYSDDDGGAGNNSMLRFRPDELTSYVVLKVRGYSEGQSGNYQLRVRQPTPRRGGWTVTEIAQEEGLDVGIIRRAARGSRLDGYLESGDELFYLYEMNGSEIHVDLTSEDFDTYVEAWLVDTERGFFLDEDEDDDSGGSQDSQLSMDTEPGTMLLVKARGYSDSGEGQFQLYVR